MEPLRRYILGEKPVREIEKLPEQKPLILADKIKEVLEGVCLWDAEVMEADLAECLEDEMLQEAYWNLLNAFLEYKENPIDSSKYEALRHAGAQCQRLMGEEAPETMESVLEALTLRYEPIWKEIEGELEQIGHRRVDRSKFKPRNEKERYYRNEGFHQLPRSPSLWTHVDIGMEDEVLNIEMTLAFPGEKEFTTKIEFTWNVPDHPIPTSETIGRAMAEVMQGEEVEGPLGRIAAEWVELLKERVVELVQVSHSPESVASETVHDVMEQRVNYLKEESLQLLKYFDRFQEKIEDSIPLREETKLVLDSLKDRMREETRIETLIFIQNMLRVVVPTAVDIRTNFIGGNPITYEDQMVLRAIAEIAELQELLESPDDELIAMIINLSNGLILGAALHPAAKAAFEAGMEPLDVLKYSDRLQYREHTINQLMVAVAEARRKAPLTTDYRVFKTEQMAKIKALRERITIEEDIAKDVLSDGGLEEILVKIDRIISEIKTEAKSFETTLKRFRKIVPISDEDIRKLKHLCSEYSDSTDYRQAVTNYMQFVIEQHDRIRESLITNGSLPDDILTVLEENGVLSNEANLQFPKAVDADELLMFSLLWTQKINNHAIFHNYQIFTDTGGIHGLDLETFNTHYKIGRDKLFRFYVKDSPPYRDVETVQATIGLYHPFESQIDPTKILLRKTDWIPDHEELGWEDGNPYFRKGKVVLGKAYLDAETKDWESIREVSVELDLTKLPFIDNREKTEAYFEIFEYTIGTELDEILIALNVLKLLEDKGIFDLKNEEILKNEETLEGLKDKEISKAVQNRNGWKTFKKKLEGSEFSDEEIKALIEHQHEFMQRVLTGFYKVHYAVMHPDDDIPGVDSYKPPS